MDLNHGEPAEDKVVLLQQVEDAKMKIIEYAMIIEEVSLERDFLKGEFFDIEGNARKREDDFERRIDEEKVCLEMEIYEGVREREALVRKIELGVSEKERLVRENCDLKGKNEELEEVLSRGLRVLGLMKARLMRFDDVFNEKDIELGVDQGGEDMEGNALILEGKLENCNLLDDFMKELDIIWNMEKRVEKKLRYYEENEDFLKEIENFKGMNKELRKSLLKCLDVLGSVQESILRVSDEFVDEKELDHECDDMEKKLLNFEEKLEGSLEMKSFFSKLESVSRMVKNIEGKISCHIEKEKKEKMELERSLISLTEENRDVHALLRVALMEKEAMEKSLSKLKGNNEQRRVPLLQRVGFGFLIGGYDEENDEDQENVANRISEDEEVVSLASTMETMMKKLRLEIAQLRRDLEESRSETERVLSVTKKQAQQITEQTVYIQELKDQEMILKQNVEELQLDINAAEEEVVRWRKACELEVEAGKCAAQEHNKMVAILTQELQKINKALQVSNKKLRSKEELASAAIAAQLAAERSLQLADRRNAAHRQRIEELTRELEEVEKREKNRRKMSRVCWPWLGVNPSHVGSVRAQNMGVKAVFPEMQSFLN